MAQADACAVTCRFAKHQYWRAFTNYERKEMVGDDPTRDNPGFIVSQFKAIFTQ
jgi:hypothetical protein